LSEVVIDASVIAKWFRAQGEPHVEAARDLRAAFEAGDLQVMVPSQLYLEILNVAGRRWSLGETALTDLAATLETLEFQVSDVELARVAVWIARGLTAYDAAYVALAEAHAALLVTDDAQLLRTAPGITVWIGDAAALTQLRQQP
jgi:predicted nucleic acid-binding protein